MCMCVCVRVCMNGLQGTPFDIGTSFWEWVILGTWEKKRNIFVFWNCLFLAFYKHFPHFFVIFYGTYERGLVITCKLPNPKYVGILRVKEQSYKITISAVAIIPLKTSCHSWPPDKEKYVQLHNLLLRIHWKTCSQHHFSVSGEKEEHSKMGKWKTRKEPKKTEE